MDIHQNAGTTPYSRAEIVRRVVEQREPVRGVARALGVSERENRVNAAIVPRFGLHSAANPRN
jgi:transposase-like protein